MSFFSQFLLTKIFGFKTKSSWEKIISTQTMLVDDLIKERNKFYKINSKYTDCEYLPGPLSRALNNGTIYFPEQLIVTYLWQYYTLKKWRYKESTIIEDINWQANS